MARTDRNGENRKKSAEELPGRAREEEAEQAVEVESEQQQARDTTQDQLGNQAVTELLGIPSVKPGQAGVALEGGRNRDEEHELLLGGDDVPPDGPLTLEDLVRSWNPTTRRGQDTADQALGEIEGLPSEDEALWAAIRADRSPLELAPASVPDALIQPSGTAIGADLRPYVRQAERWGSGTVLHRCWAALSTPPAPILTDPHGRLVFTRARTSALATLLVLDGPAVATADRTPLVSFTLELACRAGWVDHALDQVRAAQVRLPLAKDVLTPLLEGLRSGSIEPRALSAPALLHLRAAVGALLAVPPATNLLPSLIEPTAEPVEDDPLGLGDLVTSLTGGATDPLAGVYDAALQAAEKLAGACARLRVHAAGTLAAVASVCELWSSGAPSAELLHVAAGLDREVAQILQLLVEIGRAVQGRSVDPAGIRNGLRRAARMVHPAADQLGPRIEGIVGGVLPGPTDVPPPPRPTVDPLSEAWDEGAPAEALPWLAAQRPSLERDAAIVFTRLAAGQPAEAPALWAMAERARVAGRVALGGAVGICAGAALLRAGAAGAAARLAEADLETGIARRNGAWIAAAALQGIEAYRLVGDDRRAAELRHRAARICWLLGAGSSLSLLLRWRAPDPDE